MEARSDASINQLLLIRRVILDLLCIHPFRDGNGRMSRLLTTLLLYRSGYPIDKYISLETKIAKDKASYYDALQLSQGGWHEGKEDPMPFIKYLLGTIINAYRDFEDRMEMVEQKCPAIDIVKGAVQQKIGKFRKTEICELCPSFSAASVERSLKELCRTGEIAKGGSDRATSYIRNTL